MTYRKKDKRSNLVRLVDDLIGMFPDPYDRKEHRQIKKELENLEYSIKFLKKYQGYLDEISNGTFDENTFSNLWGFDETELTPLEFSKKHIVREIDRSENMIIYETRMFKNDFDSLVDRLKEEISDYESAFNNLVFSKHLVERE